MFHFLRLPNGALIPANIGSFFFLLAVVSVSLVLRLFERLLFVAAAVVVVDRHGINFWFITVKRPNIRTYCLILKKKYERK